MAVTCDPASTFEALRELGAERAAAQLVMPALDLREGEQPALAEAIERLAANPYMGFLLFGGEAAQVRRISRSLRRIAEHQGYPRPLLAADIERGLGQIVAGGRLFPTFEGLGRCPDGEARAEAMGRAIAEEGLAVGIDAPFTPVLDLADLPANPIVGSRAFGADPELVGRLGAAFVRGVESTGALACGKHFPGHGGTFEDSHDALPVVQHSLEQLRARDLRPFRDAMGAGLSWVMTAHVAYAAFGDGELPATLEPRILKGLLRGEMGFEGIVVTDAFIMSGLLQACGGDEAAAAVAAIDAGCDIILYPTDPEPVRRAIAAAIEERGWGWVEPSLRRVLERKTRLPEPPSFDLETAAALAEGSAREAADAVLRAPAPEALAAFREAPALRVVVLDDDGGSEAGLDFLCAARETGKDLALSWVDPKTSEAELAQLEAVLGACERPRLTLVRCSIKAWKGRPGLHETLAKALERDLAFEAAPQAVVALTGERPLAPFAIPAARLVQTFGEGPACEGAAARALFG